MIDLGNVIIIEPHLEMVRRNLLTRAPISGANAIKDKDVTFLKREIQKHKNESKLVLVDLFPFTSIGADRTETLKGLVKNTEVYFIVRENDSGAQLVGLNYLRFNDEFQLTECSTNDKSISSLVKDYIKFKLKYIEEQILQFIKNDAIVTSQNATLIHLQDGTGANKWIDIKGLLGKPEKTFYIAYQIGYILSNGYLNKELEIDGFIVGNNNALPIASLLSIFFNKSLFIVDKLGPQPRLHPNWLIEMREHLQGKKLVIIEDVISTGREVDLLYFFLTLQRVVVKKIISVVDLKCAHPILLDPSDLICLCSPSHSLEYKRILAYEKIKTT